jgi:hypothetical protein
LSGFHTTKLLLELTSSFVLRTEMAGLGRLTQVTVDVVLKAL